MQNINILSRIRYKNLFNLFTYEVVFLIIAGGLVYAGFAARDTPPIRFFGFIVGGMLLLLVLWWVVLTVRTIINPYKDRELCKFPEYGSPAELADQINAELQSATKIGKKTYQTRNWLVYISLSDFKLVRLDEIAWIYAKHSSIRINSASTYTDSVMIFDGQGREATFEEYADTTDAIVRAVAMRRPGVRAGYNEAYKMEWERNKPQFVEEYKKRRKSAMGG